MTGRAGGDIVASTGLATASTSGVTGDTVAFSSRPRTRLERRGFLRSVTSFSAPGEEG
jgi:hypothetical protein